MLRGRNQKLYRVSGKNRIRHSAFGQFSFAIAQAHFVLHEEVLLFDRQDVDDRMQSAERRNALFPQKPTPGGIPGVVDISRDLFAEACDQSAKERTEAEESEQRQQRSCLWQSLCIALALVGGVSVISILIGVRIVCIRLRPGGRLIRVSAARRAARRALRVLIGRRSRSRSCAALSVLIGRARRCGRRIRLA